MMRALVYDGPRKLSVQDRPDPRPQPGEVLLRIIATGICGSDLHGYTGENGRRHPRQVMGHETVARVVDANSNNSAIGDHQDDHHGTDGEGDPVWDIGALVTINPVIGCGACRACHLGQPQQCADRRVIGVDPTYSAAMAEYMVVPEANIVRLPPDLRPEVGALIEPLAVGWHAVRRGTIRPDDRVLVQGAGPIGQAVALAARRAGATQIVVSEPDARRRAAIAEFGFEIVDPTAVGAGSLAPDGTPFDLVVDGVGSDRSIESALTNTTLGGRIVLVGMNEPRLNIDAYAISSAERSVVGSFCYTPAEFAATASWVADHSEELLRLIDGSVDLDGAAAAFKGLADRSLPASKVLIFPHGLGDASQGRGIAASAVSPTPNLTTGDCAE
jgi:threonine dehydrogenase-like Zn-dependent dehydrogenase